MRDDRIFGLVVVAIALAFIASALGLESSFLSDPVGSKAFPIGIGVVMGLCGSYMALRPDPDVRWPAGAAAAHMLVALAVLIGYALTLKPLGFLLPTALAASVIAYLLGRNWRKAALGGCGLAVGLFVLFKFALGLGLAAWPRALFA